MTDQYLRDNAPRDILLSLQELSQKNIPHAATFKLAAARIAELTAALKPFADMNCQTTDKPGLYSCIVTHKMMADAARAAYLGEKG